MQRIAGEWGVETIGTTFCVEAANFVGTENALCNCKTKDRNEKNCIHDNAPFILNGENKRGCVI